MTMLHFPGYARRMRLLRGKAAHGFAGSVTNLSVAALKPDRTYPWARICRSAALTSLVFRAN
jgi:hypothetical protein